MRWRYNDGSRRARTELAHRLHAGMKAAIRGAEYVPAEPLTWRTYPLVLRARTEPEYTVAASRARMLDPKQPASVRIYRGAMPLAFAARSDRPIQLCSLAIGKLHIVNLPGEPMIEFQRYAQSLLPGCFVAVAGYGDSCCGYVCTDAAYRERGYEPADTLAAPGAEARLKQAIRNLMGVVANSAQYVGVVQAGERLIAAGGRRAEVGRELIEWAAGDLRIYFQQCHDRQAGVFVAKTTDGEPIRWREAREGYYTRASFAPVRPDGTLLWGYAMAYRLTRSQPHWEMLRTLAGEMGYGELGQPDGAGRSLRLDPRVNDWRGLYVLLETHRATRNPGLLPIAMTLADRLASSQTKTGVFPRPGRHWARTGDEIPLAILHLAATLQNRQSELPPPTFDRRFFHCEYDGPLSKQQRKRADKRTYDSLVFYGS